MDWIERAQRLIEYPPKDYGFYNNVLHDGIEEVRALRKERDELKADVALFKSNWDSACSRAAKADSRYIDVCTERDNFAKQVERLEKEKAGLRENLAKGYDILRQRNDRIAELETLHAEACEIIADLEEESNKDGATLRDEFAMAALPKILEEHRGLGSTFQEISKLSYQCADRMMEARKK